MSQASNHLYQKFVYSPTPLQILRDQLCMWSAVVLLPGSDYLEPTSCFCLSYYLCQFFQIFFEKFSIFKKLFSNPIAQRCVCVCVCVHVCMYVLNLCCQNIYSERICKCLGPLWVRHYKNPLLLLCDSIKGN